MKYTLLDQIILLIITLAGCIYIVFFAPDGVSVVWGMVTTVLAVVAWVAIVYKKGGNK